MSCVFLRIELFLLLPWILVCCGRTNGNAPDDDVAGAGAGGDAMGCHSPVSVAVQHRPPYVKYDSAHDTHTGALLHGLVRYLDECCGHQVALVFLNCTRCNDSFLSLPADVHAPIGRNAAQLAAFSTYGSHNGFTPFMQSSGNVQLLQHEQRVKAGGAHTVVSAVLSDGWPFLVLLLLSAAYAGLLIWAIEMHWNRGQFPRSVLHGLCEGLWWSVITMTTVGYGDKTPRTIVGRLFTILHVLLGLVFCALFTGAVTAVVSSNTYRPKLHGKKVGVLSDSPEYYVATSADSYPIEFEDIDELVAEAVDMEGVLVEGLQWRAYRERVQPQTIQETFEYDTTMWYYGAMFNVTRFPLGVMECMTRLAFRGEDQLHRSVHGEYSEKTVESKRDDHRATRVLRSVLSVSQAAINAAVIAGTVWVALVVAAVGGQLSYFRYKHVPVNRLWRPEPATEECPRDSDSPIEQMCDKGTNTHATPPTCTCWDQNQVRAEVTGIDGSV